MSTLYTKYLDTEVGAFDFIKNETCLTLTENSIAVPDPAVQGVWKVTELEWGPNYKHIDAIVYMGGYPDPFGNIRDTNDFESSEGKQA